MTSKQTPTVEVPGTIFKRPDTVNLWYGVAVPSDLAHLPQYLNENGKPIKWAYRRSLGTSDRAEAERLALGVLQKLQDQWAIERRQANPVKVSDLSPEVVTQLAEYIRFCVFNADDYDWQHYVPLIERKPGALRNGAPFADLPEPLQRMRKALHPQPAFTGWPTALAQNSIGTVAQF